MDVAVVVEIARPHHEVDHEGEHAENLHEVLVPVKLGQRVRVRLGHESMVIKVLLGPKEGLARDAADRQNAGANR